MGRQICNPTPNPINTEPINFFLAKNIKNCTDDTLLTISYKYTIDTIQNTNEIIDNNILIRKTFLLPQYKYVKVIRAQVKAHAAQLNQEKEMLLVSIGEGRATSIMTWDAIIKRLDNPLQRES